MSLFTPEQLQSVKNSVDIVHVIGQYIPLEKKGKKFRGICPFHDDHDPSLQVDPDRQIYKCFVCGAGGDAIRFVQKMEEITFPEAVQRLAQEAGLPMAVQFSPARTSPKTAARTILDAYFQYCTYNLQTEDGLRGKAYLEKRKISPDMIGHFRLGWSGTVQQNQRYFAGKQFDVTGLAQTGLLQEDFPVFHDRLVIPIFDAQGNPAGITARTLDADPDIPKYINTGQTPLYTKGDLIFHYHQAKTEARKAGRAILCEGAMDVIGLAKAGLYEGVCCLGTACTSRQLELLKQLQVPVHVFYDADKAGQKAAYAFGQAAMKAGLKFSIVKPGPEKDPDEIFNKFGAAVLKQTVDKTVSYPEFLLDYLQAELNLDNYEDRMRYAEEVRQAASRLCTDFEQRAVLERLQEKTGYRFEPEQAVPVPARPQPQKRPAAARPPGKNMAEEAVLVRMLESRDAMLQFYDEIGFFQDPVCNTLALYIQDGWSGPGPLSVDGLFEQIEEEEVADLLGRIVADGKDCSPVVFEESLHLMQKRVLMQQIEILAGQIRQESDPGRKLELAGQKQNLLKKRDALDAGLMPNSTKNRRLQ